MLDFGRLIVTTTLAEPRGIAAPLVLPENAKRLSNGFEQALRGDLDRCSTQVA